MRKIVLLVLLINIFLSVKSQIVTPSININKDSSFHATSTTDVITDCEHEFIVKISNTRILTCSKENADTYSFKLVDDKFTVLEAVKIADVFQNIADIVVFKERMSNFSVPQDFIYIADNSGTTPLVYRILLNDLFSVGIVTPSVYVMSNYSYIKKILVSRDLLSQTNKLYSIGQLQNYKYALSCVSGNNIITTDTNSIEPFIDLKFYSGNIYTLSSNGGNIILRKFNSTTLNEISRTSREVGSYIFNKCFDFMSNGNIAVGVSYQEGMTGNEVYKMGLMFFDQNLNFLKGYNYNENFREKYLEIKEMRYSENDTSLYLIRTKYINSDRKNVLGKIEVSDFLNSISTQERTTEGNNCLQKLINFNDRFVVSMGVIVSDNYEHFYKCSKNITKSSTLCDRNVSSLFTDKIFYYSNISALNPPITNTISLSNYSINISKESYISDFAYECIPIIFDFPPIQPNNDEDKDKMISVEEEIFVYPNPAIDVVNVKSSYEIERIELYNTFGQVVYTNDVNANNVTVSTANLEKGTYFVKAYANGMTAIKKVVVE